MTNSLAHTTQIILTEKSSAATPDISPTVTEPFTAGRAAPRLLFDFGVMASLMNPSVLDQPVLDFGAGTGWVSEFCARMGFQTVAFDIHGDLQGCLENRAKADYRIDERLLSFAHGDGHAMPFEAGTFGHLLCYDTLHHMHDYPKVFSEFFRVLRRGGAWHFCRTRGAAQHFTRDDSICKGPKKTRSDLDRTGRRARRSRPDRSRRRIQGRFIYRANASSTGIADLFYERVETVQGR